jgi:undecaprenyl-diphosphatase
LIAGVNQLDRACLMALGSRRVPRRVDRTLKAVTHLGGTSATLLFCLALLPSPGTRALGFAAILANALSHLIVQVLKRSVVRPRPMELVPLAHHPDAFSFPSGHACAASTMAVMLTVADPALGVPTVMVALLVGLSRVYLRVHYVTDVVVGQFIGAVTALLVSLALP